MKPKPNVIGMDTGSYKGQSVPERGNLARLWVANPTLLGTGVKELQILYFFGSIRGFYTQYYGELN